MIRVTLLEKDKKKTGKVTLGKILHANGIPLVPPLLSPRLFRYLPLFSRLEFLSLATRFALFPLRFPLPCLFLSSSDTLSPLLVLLAVSPSELPAASVSDSEPELVLEFEVDAHESNA